MATLFFESDQLSPPYEIELPPSLLPSSLPSDGVPLPEPSSPLDGETTVIGGDDAVTTALVVVVVDVVDVVDVVVDVVVVLVDVVATGEFFGTDTNEAGECVVTATS